MNERSKPARFVRDHRGVWSVTLKFPMLHGTAETTQRALSTTCSRTARKRCDALRQAWGM